MKTMIAFCSLNRWLNVKDKSTRIPSTPMIQLVMLKILVKMMNGTLRVRKLTRLSEMTKKIR